MNFQNYVLMLLSAWMIRIPIFPSNHNPKMEVPLYLYLFVSTLSLPAPDWPPLVLVDIYTGSCLGLQKPCNNRVIYLVEMCTVYNG